MKFFSKVDVKAAQGVGDRDRIDFSGVRLLGGGSKYQIFIESMINLIQRFGRVIGNPDIRWI